MLPELKAQWVEALRSDRYKQGRNALRSEGASGSHVYCCLGVLCDVLGREWHEEWHEGEDGYYLHDIPRAEMDLDDDNEEELDRVHWSDIVPDRLAQSIALPEDTMNQLVRMNDDEGAGFEEIADWIDVNL